MIKVNLPDGAVANFPDGTSPGIIKAVLTKHFPPKDNAYGQSGVGQFATGANEGLANTLGFPVDMATAAISLGMKGINKVAGTDLKPNANPFMGSQFIKEAMGPIIHPESKDPGKKLLRRVGQDVGASVVPGLGVAARANAPLRSAATAVLSGLGSGTGAGIAQTVAPGNRTAEIVGQLIGGFTPAGVTAGVRRAVTPFPTNPGRLQMADNLAAEGVDTTAGQRTGSQTLRYAEAELGGRRAENVMERQAVQFTRAALRRAGINADRATPDVLDDGFRDIGQQFDNLAARNDLVPVNRQIATDLVGPNGVVRTYYSLVPESQRAPIVQEVVGDIGRAFSANGQISGEAYQALRSRLDKSARASRFSDPQLSEALFGIRSALDNGMETSIRVRNPHDLGAWRDVRRQYKNMLVIEKAATGAGENAAGGLISPSALRNATTTQNRRDYARGRGDFAELARSGEGTMKPLPQSGTAPRMAARSLGTGILTILGAAAGAPGGFVGSAIGAAAGAAVPKVIGRAMMSRPGQNYLANQIAAAPLDPLALEDMRRAILAAQLSGQLAPQ